MSAKEKRKGAGGSEPRGRRNREKFIPVTERPWVSAEDFLGAVREEKERLYGPNSVGSSLKTQMQGLGVSVESPSDLPQEEFDADRFASHLLMTSQLRGDAPTGEQMYEAVSGEVLASGITDQAAVEAQTFPIVAKTLGVPEYTIRFWYATRLDDVRTPDGLTPKEWIRSSQR